MRGRRAKSLKATRRRFRAATTFPSLAFAPSRLPAPLRLHLPHRRLRREPAAPAGESLAAALLPAALDGACGVALPRFVPFAERIAMPRRLRLECRQAQLFPHGARALHEWLRRQR